MRSLAVVSDCGAWLCSWVIAHVLLNWVNAQLSCDGDSSSAKRARRSRSNQARSFAPWWATFPLFNYVDGHRQRLCDCEAGQMVETNIAWDKNKDFKGPRFNRHAVNQQNCDLSMIRKQACEIHADSQTMQQSSISKNLFCFDANFCTCVRRVNICFPLPSSKTLVCEIRLRGRKA